MSTINRLTLRLARLLAEPERQGVDIEAMNLRQWADLPAYHPHRDRPTPSAPR